MSDQTEVPRATQNLAGQADSGAREVARQREMAKRHANQGEFDQAIACWRNVERLDPLADDAPQMIASLTVKRARQEPAAKDVSQNGETEEAALRSAESKPASALNANAPPVPAPEPRELVFTRRQELEQAIHNNPEDETNYLDLAELHLAAGRTYDAQRTLSKAFDISADVRILERLEDVNILRAQELVDLARRRAVEENTTKARQAIDERREELERLKVEVNRARCERYPDDGYLKFQLGISMKRSGELKQALEYLRGGLTDPRCRAVASLEIGEILQRYKQFPKALQCYRQAAQLAANDGEQVDCRRRALYRAGVLATEMKLFDSARAYLAELVRCDPSYKDATTRLDKLAEISENL